MMADTWLTGRRGQALAIAIGLLAFALAWFGAVAPVLSWYNDRNLLLERRQALLHRMQDVAATLPALRAASRKPDPDDTAATTMVPGASDAVAAADLQERVQQMAGTAGVNLTAIETLPATVTGEWHRVSLRVSLTAPWPVLMDLLRAIEQSPTGISIDDVHFHSATLATHPTLLPVQASMVLYGFRPAAATARSGDGT